MGLILTVFMIILWAIRSEPLRYRLAIATFVPLGLLLLFIFFRGAWLFGYLGLGLAAILPPLWLLFWSFVFISEIVAKRFKVSKLIYAGFTISLSLWLYVLFNFYNLPYMDYLSSK